MLAITVTPENSSRLLGTELLAPKTRREDAACVARAIAQLMDHEWREFLDQEQRERAGSLRSASQRRNRPINKNPPRGRAPV